MLRFAANLSFLFNEVPFLERFTAAAAQGFAACEFMSPYDWPEEEVHARARDAGVKVVLFNAALGDWGAGERGLAALPGREAVFDAAIEQALAYARVLGNSLLHVMAGTEQHGAQRDVFVRNLQRAADRAAGDGVTLVVEPINTRDMPGYFVNRSRQALDILADVDRKNAGLQFDFYHRQIMDGDVERGFAEALPLIRHIQIASPPDRGEPDCGGIDYSRVFEMIDASGYAGHIGLEYKPRGDTVAGLRWAKALGVTLGEPARDG